MRKVIPSCVAIAIVAIGLAVGPAHADDERQRPWPDEWPIELPPVEGPLPPPPRFHDRVSSANPAAARVLAEIRRVRSAVRASRYQHRLQVRERDGVYHWDCSLMVQWILRRTSRPSVRGLPSSRRALAADFVRLIERAPTDRFRRGWQRLEHIDEVRPGDVFAWRRPRGFPSRNTGHVGFVTARPEPVHGMPGAYAVEVADATRSTHQNDSRPWPGDGGFGIGTLAFLTDGHGQGTHYGWGGTYSGGYVVTPILFGRVGPR